MEEKTHQDTFGSQVTKVWSNIYKKDTVGNAELTRNGQE